MIRGACKGLAATDKMLTIHMYIFVLCVSQIVFLRVYFWRREEKEKKRTDWENLEGGLGAASCWPSIICHEQKRECQTGDREMTAAPCPRILQKLRRKLYSTPHRHNMRIPLWVSGKAHARAPLCGVWSWLGCHGNLHHCNHGDGEQGSRRGGCMKSKVGVITSCPSASGLCAGTFYYSEALRKLLTLVCASLLNIQKSAGWELNVWLYFTLKLRCLDDCMFVTAVMRAKSKSSWD